MKKKENIEKFDWELLAKQVSDESNSQEKLKVKDWLSQSDNNRKKLEQTKKMLNKIDTYYQAKKFNTNLAWINVHAQISPSKEKSIQHKKKRKEAIAQFYKYAAIVVVALLLGSIGYLIGFRNQNPAVYNEIISAENQVLKEYVLPDGSVVALNSNSKLLFPRKFKGNIREVTIIGEAFFDVKPNPEKPFLINAGDAQIKVLGTSFNVCAYPGTETIEVTVKTGKVQVISKHTDLITENREVFLTPGEKGTLFSENHLLEKSVNTDPNFLAWKTHDLIFNEVPLIEVVRSLEKAYHIEIDLKEPELNDLLYEGHFDQKPIDFVLDVIRLTFNLDLSVDNELYTLSSRTNKQ
ncbi:FecR domain-containing protein [Prolixibacteraceae bacterium Z1-6]|uniref:FecR domain-containing protein n=1 Tax=Draconibacterium aestuarii TaxID=2998507 RepID=A0A9X3FAV7_9BACT|nr:FecR domain-containing protein [Prolixibacteraceae bacterium Z1-6]